MSEPALGIYLYGVIAAPADPQLVEVHGVDPSFPLKLIDHQRLRAVVSSVPLEEFGTQALKSNLEDLRWLARVARAHAAVLEHLLPTTTAVPIRLCTVFTEEASVHRLLEREHNVFLDAIDRLTGRSEWSVKVLLTDPDALGAAAQEHHPGPADDTEEDSPGRAYLSRKMSNRQRQDEKRAVAEAATEEIHTTLSETATASTLLPAQNRALSGRPGEMILNAAYLVNLAHADAFASMVKQLAERHRHLGLHVESTGPWPPYNFAASPVRAP